MEHEWLFQKTALWAMRRNNICYISEHSFLIFNLLEIQPTYMDPSCHFQLVIILISENDLHVLFYCVMKNPFCTKSTAEINRYTHDSYACANS